MRKMSRQTKTHIDELFLSSFCLDFINTYVLHMRFFSYKILQIFTFEICAPAQKSFLAANDARVC